MEPLDRNHLLRTLDGDRELVAEIVRTFLATTPDLVEATRRAVCNSDHDGVRYAAHQLKGSLATMGAGPAAQAAARLETAGRNGAAAELPQALADLEAEMSRLMPELAGLAQPGGDPAPS
jgi:HPt (histidine-containing phosphotransfer) domain-containing protein